MPKDPEKPEDAGKTGTIQRLVRETGITEAEASELIALLGTDWSSLVREAHLLRQKR